MKLLQITFFSLLIGSTIAAHADTALDKSFAKCEQLLEQKKEAWAQYEEIGDEYKSVCTHGNGAASQCDELFSQRKSASRKSDKLEMQYSKANCSVVFDQKRAEEKGLSSQ